ncbi:SRPBCC family protein [Microbacterium sp. EYE_5]|uniref:SRPBCC family protein n=1 Tax=unclassified Microbacterium TaxID=2609290 RepID=UPI002005497B|nr:MULTISPECIES: SRPBCC family protein [unclassified Microbacterium]MCK6081457.1 SRPBCC family protein [Microbacterium sp. EYE_382]MCK6086727.1 SRPBCC family protein [Microbacterium sp. EYE_384]MCK6123775.1 SRPBCC family protein [Microbacterium sp. EYE_80]MCK6126684.1 SRPBCC family protein [Microbacterium sp. EYE_79]MCK6142412.1 SRPBCC family protein [Microbacterium sp. EYE_39]
MSRNTRLFACTPDDVFAVLADGWLFPSWVVGASRMREVAESWPQVGSRLHHSFGVWPVLIDDATEVLEYEHPRHIVLRAKGWPMGEARVDIQVKPHPEGAIVRIQEEAVAGPGGLVPKPLLDIPLQLRNAETLHRLAYLAEGRASRPTDETTAEDEGVGE